MIGGRCRCNSSGEELRHWQLALCLQWRFAFNGGAIQALCFLPWQWVANCCVWGPAKIDSRSPQMQFQPFVVRIAYAASSEEESK